MLVVDWVWGACAHETEATAQGSKKARTKRASKIIRWRVNVTTNLKFRWIELRWRWTATGLNLEGVRRVLELESELERLRAELDEARAQAKAAVAATHRHYRRDLVPLRQSPVAYTRR